MKTKGHIWACSVLYLSAIIYRLNDANAGNRDSAFASLRPYSVAATELRYRCRHTLIYTHMHKAGWMHTLTPRLRLRRQCILGLEVMKSLRRWERGSFCCLGDWGSLGTAEGEGGDEAGGAGGGWWGDVNRDISYQYEREPWRRRRKNTEVEEEEGGENPTKKRHRKKRRREHKTK